MAVLLAAAMLVGQTFTNGIDQTPFDPGDTPTPGSEEVEVPLSPYAYLYATYPKLARRMDCVISRESKWNPGAVNSKSGAAGLAQFLLSTWLTTPQGASGASRYDPYANIDGAAWLATHSGWFHWTVVLYGYC